MGLLKRILSSGLPTTKRFSGKTYHKFNAYDSTQIASQDAASVRKKGYSARVVVFTKKGRKGVAVIYTYPDTPHWYSAAYLKKRKK